MFGCSYPSPSCLGENSLICLWIMLFVFNDLCFVVCAFVFALCCFVCVLQIALHFFPLQLIFAFFLRFVETLC